MAWSHRRAALVIGLLVFGLIGAGAAGAAQDDVLVISAGTGQVLGKVDWSANRLSLRAAGLTAGQDLQLEVLDGAGTLLLQRPFTVVTGGAAKLTVDTTGVTKPPAYTVQLRSIVGGAPGDVIATGRARGQR